MAVPEDEDELVFAFLTDEITVPEMPEMFVLE